MTKIIFSQADVKRAIRAVEATGKVVAAVDFPPHGGFRLILGEPIALEPRNEWDDVLALP